MAPAAKRKKPGAEDQSSATALKGRAKRQKTATDPTDSIETPPPTPKPAPAPAARRGRKPNAAKSAKENGKHVKQNGVAETEVDDASTVDQTSAVDSPPEAPAVMPPSSTAKRKVVFVDEDKDEEEHEQ